MSDTVFPEAMGSGVEPRVAKLEAGMEYVRQDLRDIKVDLRDLRNRQEQGFQHLLDRQDQMSAQQERDFRLLFATFMATVLSLAGLMAKGFGWLP